MPELPDITVYVEALEARIHGATLESLGFASPFVLRSVSPGAEEFAGKCVQSVTRVGKRIAIGLEDEMWIVLHLMIAGRLQWRARMEKRFRGKSLANFRFSTGTLWLTEAGSKKRASLYLVHGKQALSAHDPGGLEVSVCDEQTFDAALRARNHTLKRALTDPRILSGIGNAYSDEILHRARLSPVQLTQNLPLDDMRRLYAASRAVLAEWTERLRAQTGAEFPRKVTAFRDDMAVHGRYGKPCPVCAAPVQRIRYASRETNYCARCQTGGRLLADRSLSRLLRKDWPRHIDEM